MNSEYQANDFLGTGWSFPPHFRTESKTVAMTEREEDIQRSLEILLSTRTGERVMEPKYGCNLDEYLFESLDTTTKTIIADKVQTAILYFEARIDVKRVNVNSERENEGLILIEVEYVVRATNSRFNFVFPYYKSEGSELDLLTINKPFV